MSSSSRPLKADVNLSLTLSPPPLVEATIKPEQRSIKLIQLLLICTNHAFSGNVHHADACLQQISQLASVTGDSVQRLAAWFASALAVRLVKRWPGVHKGLNCNGLSGADLDRAWTFFTKSVPCMGFAYSIIIETLTKALSRERIVHIVDLGSGDPQLWIAFLRSFANSVEESPPCLKITCVHNNKIKLDNLETGLVKEAQSLGLQFQFNPINVVLKNLTLDMLKANPAEALAITSVLNFHTLLAEDDQIDARFGLNKSKGVKQCKQLREYLHMLRSVSPKVVFLVEQESNHNLNSLVDRFVEGLHYYSALFDLIDATFRKNSCEERSVIEQMFGKEIENVVACEGVEREERHENFGEWATRFGQAGFRPVRLWFDVMEETKKIVGTCGINGYKVISQKGSLMICWHDRPIYAVSAWTCSN